MWITFDIYNATVIHQAGSRILSTLFYYILVWRICWQLLQWNDVVCSNQGNHFCYSFF